MTECVILFRNTGNGKVGFVSESEEHSDNIATFQHREAALAAVPEVPILRAFPYQIVELDELP